MNRLSASTSLYLRQHADNPVHWQPWDETALAEARAKDRPILLSVGYSACHWCHVMAHECFEDREIAALMNDLFVNIKVDREERPDLDKVYQLAHQLLTGRGGGWPLTVFLDPASLTPFFAGTYFPPQPRHGMPSFPEVLEKVRDWYDSNRDEVETLNANLQSAIGALQRPSGEAGGSDADVFAAAAEQAAARFDTRHGGFGGAPKFPQAPLLASLEPVARQSGEDRILDMLHATLHHMARGGLRDHLDGGFFRYAVDGRWTIPHFEKMLYDNALLLPLYAEAARSRSDTWLHEVAEGIAAWLTDEMRQDNGGFSSSIDADADGEEGGYHVWQREEVRERLNSDEFEAFAAAFGLNGPPNFEDRAWHLVRHSEPGPEPLLDAAVRKLKDARAERVPPATDRKQLTAWNALCVEGFARAGLALETSAWLDVAEDCHAFLATRLWNDGRLHAVHADGESHLEGYLDDYAFLLQATLSLLGARWNDERLDFAVRLGNALLERFRDTGGFFFTAAGQDVPMRRLRLLQDDATPAGNGIAAQALLRLGHLTADNRYLDAAQEVLESARSEMRKYPLGHASLLRALDEAADPPAQVIITGRDGEEAQRWREMVQGFDRVHCYVLEAGSGQTPGAIERPPGDELTAFLCLGRRCLPPISSGQGLEEELRKLD